MSRDYYPPLLIGAESKHCRITQYSEGEKSLMVGGSRFVPQKEKVMKWRVGTITTPPPTQPPNLELKL